MNIRWEVTEQDWLAHYAHSRNAAVDYVSLDLDFQGLRPWLAEARARVELIGRCAGPGTQAALERALELDVDFLCLCAGAGELDYRRLPLRLLVEAETLEPDPVPWSGVAWARRIRDWEAADPGELALSARRERIFLVASHDLPAPDLLERVAPFAVAIPSGSTPAGLRALAGG